MTSSDAARTPAHLACAVDSRSGLGHREGRAGLAIACCVARFSDAFGPGNALVARRRSGGRASKNGAGQSRWALAPQAQLQVFGERPASASSVGFTPENLVAFRKYPPDTSTVARLCPLLCAERLGAETRLRDPCRCGSYRRGSARRASAPCQPLVGTRALGTGRAADSTYAARPGPRATRARGDAAGVTASAR